MPTTYKLTPWKERNQPPNKRPALAPYAFAGILALITFALLYRAVNLKEFNECRQWAIENNLSTQPLQFQKWQLDQCKAHKVNLSQFPPVEDYQTNP